MQVLHKIPFANRVSAVTAPHCIAICIVFVLMHCLLYSYRHDIAHDELLLWNTHSTLLHDGHHQLYVASSDTMLITIFGIMLHKHTCHTAAIHRTLCLYCQTPFYTFQAAFEHFIMNALQVIEKCHLSAL